MKRVSIICAVTFFLVGHAFADNAIRVSFWLDGSPARCDGFAVSLRLNGESIIPTQKDQRFEPPDQFKRPAKSWTDHQRVDISLSCNGLSLVFPNQHPAFVRPGDWKLGIAGPLYAVTEYGYTHEFDRGARLAYLVFEGEPGVITFSSVPDPSPDSVTTLLEEQLKASPARGRDIAYVLAISNVDYRKNRDYLLDVLKGCLSRPKESPEDDICDRDLLKFITNLYWRGDDDLLAPLLQIAQKRGDVVGDLGIYYADVLRRHLDAALSALGELPVDKQQLVCKMAYEDDFSGNLPKRDRVITSLRTAANSAASECLKAFDRNPK